MKTVKSKLFNFIGGIEKSTVFMSMSIAFAIAYYINSLTNVDLTEWNRTFCSAVLAGISIDARIGNFYKLFFLYLPLLIILFTCILTVLFKYRERYKEVYSKFSIFLFIAAIASYISRYTSNYDEINDNPMLLCILVFLVVLGIISFLDRKQKIGFKDAVLIFITYTISVTTSAMLFHAEDIFTYIWIVGIVVVVLVSVLLNTVVGDRLTTYLKTLVCLLAWLPAMIRATLEGIYILIENGHGIDRYFTHLSRASLAIIAAAMLIAWLIRKKKWNISVFGYAGAIVSLSMIGFITSSYQYTFSYSGMANIYELGNGSVAMDTFLYGKLPIIDYFSAHALGDVWTRLIYCFVNGDVNGILVNPYGGLSTIVAFVALFFIIKQIFDEDIAVLYVLLFPGKITGIKWVSVCSISIAVLLYILKKPSIKSYIVFWICMLISAFYTYDEGIMLGVACILAFCIGCILRKEWKKAGNFILTGASAGAVVLLLYCCYAIATGLPVIGRIKEWMSVGVGSSSSWATADFGDQTSFAFLLSYYIVPITAVMILVFVIVKYIKNRKNINLVILTTVFSLAEILYITRTIVYHNLAVCSGITEVLLNFIHWTVSIYVLYLMTEKEKHESKKLLAFTVTMMAVILIEGTAVTKIWPSSDSALLSRSLKATDSWNLTDDVTYNKNQPRIVYDEYTASLVNSFKNVFDNLMTEDQTFLDFANITSMYLMTGRTRPCYVGQSPSLLTDLYSQECFLEEISEYDCPLAVLGTTETSYLQQMAGIPHNIRYYKIAEYIYNNYRPLLTFGEFAIWCEKDLYDEYFEKATLCGFAESGYTLVDYGYDFTTWYTDENGNIQFTFAPYHSYNLEDVPYIWANYDDYNASDNAVLTKLPALEVNKYVFEGSQKYVSEAGNYLSFSMANITEDDIPVNVVFYDSNNEGAKTQYQLNVKPGENNYLIRISGDYFWDVFNIDTILFGNNESVTVQNVKILEGD